MPVPAYAAFHLIVVASVLTAAAAQSSEPSAQTYRAATGLLNRGLHEQAAQQYRAFLQDSPAGEKASHARYGLAVCLARLGQHREALTALEQIDRQISFEFAPDSALLAAQCKMALGDPKAAQDALEQLIKNFPTFASIDAATAQLGEAQYAAGNAELARATLTRALATWPTSAAMERGEYLLAICEVATGADAAAAARLVRWRAAHTTNPLVSHAALVEAQCRHRLGEHERAITLYTAASEQSEPSIQAPARMGLAQLARSQGNPAEAARLLESLARSNSAAVDQASLIVELARCQYDLGEYAKALELLEPLSQRGRDRTSAEVALWMGRSELRLNQPANAEAIFRRALAAHVQDPLAPQLQLDHAAALTAMGEHARAARVCEALLAQGGAGPVRVRAQFALASARHRAGAYQQSLEACHVALDLAGSDAPVSADVRLLIAENHYLLKAYDAAQTAYGQFLERAPAHAQAWRAGVRRGLCLAQLKQPQAAASALQPLLEKDPGSDADLSRAACICLGEIAFDDSDWAQAQKWLSVVARGTGTGADAARLKLALTLVRQNRQEEALSVLDTIETGAAPKDAAIQATFERGQVLVELRRDDEARQAFERVLELESGVSQPRLRVHALRHLAAIASSQGRTADAAELLGQLSREPGQEEGAAQAALDRAVLLLGSGEYARAEEAFGRFLRENPGHARVAQAQAQHAIALSRMGKLGDAIEAFERVTPPMRAILEPEIAAALEYERAWALAQSRRTADAVAAYVRVLESRPPARIEAHAALELAQLKLAANDVDQALPLLERGLRVSSQENSLQPVAARCTYLSAVCLLRAGQPARAAAMLERFDQTFPDSELADSVAVTLGEALLVSGQSAQAVKVLARVAERTAHPPMQSAALLRLGEAAAAAADWKVSQQAFARHRQLFEDSDQWFRAAFGLGFAQENAGDREAAIETYKALVGAHQGPTAARAQFQIGECLYALGRLDEAVAELLKVDILHQYPQWSAPALYEAGRCLAEQNKPAQAAAQFEEVIRRFPDSQWAVAARDAAAAARPASLPGQSSPRSDVSSRKSPNR